MIIPLRTSETVSGFGLPRTRRTLTAFSEGSPSWSWAGPHGVRGEAVRAESGQT